jgi:hypothetical protein
MNIGHAYMGVAGILILAGALMGFNGVDPYGDILLLISLPIVYHASNKMADARKEGEADAE